MSTLSVTNISDGTNSTSATNVVKGSAKAWVNFNGTGTVAIREDYNVSSITDRGTGKYTVNFSTSMPDANYCATYTPSSGTENVEDDRQVCITSLTSGSFYISASDSGDNSWKDAFVMCAVVFR